MRKAFTPTEAASNRHAAHVRELILRDDGRHAIVSQALANVLAKATGFAGEAGNA